jgi:hypothetical protein
VKGAIKRSGWATVPFQSVIKLKFICALVPAGLLIPAAPALAEQPYYFHRADVSRDQYMDNVNECAELSGGVRAPHYQFAIGSTPANAAITAGIGSFFAAMAQGRERRRLISRVERTCMADKGYRRRSLDKGISEEMKALEGAAKIERMFALVSAQQPSGKELVE